MPVSTPVPSPAPVAGPMPPPTATPTTDIVVAGRDGVTVVYNSSDSECANGFPAAVVPAFGGMTIHVCGGSMDPETERHEYGHIEQKRQYGEIGLAALNAVAEIEAFFGGGWFDQYERWKRNAVEMDASRRVGLGENWRH